MDLKTAQAQLRKETIAMKQAIKEQIRKDIETALEATSLDDEETIEALNEFVDECDLKDSILGAMRRAVEEKARIRALKDDTLDVDDLKDKDIAEIAEIASWDDGELAQVMTEIVVDVAVTMDLGNELLAAEWLATPQPTV